MTEDRKRILTMLADGKITADEAERLLDAMGRDPAPQTGNVWLMRLYAQKKAPTFTTMQQKLDPIPDDHSKWFRDGCVAYSHRYSSNPNVKGRFEAMKADWFTAVDAAARQNDREDENKSFFPDRPIMAPMQSWDTGPIPYRWGWR